MNDQRVGLKLKWTQYEPNMGQDFLYNLTPKCSLFSSMALMIWWSVFFLCSTVLTSSEHSSSATPPVGKD